MKTLGLSALLGLLLVVAGCVTPVTHTTASGRPEVTVSGRLADQVIARLTDRMINRQYNVKTSSTTLLVFEKPINDLVIAMLYGSSYDSKPADRVTYTIVQSDASTRVVASLAVITNPGSAFERVTSMDDSPDSRVIQRILDDLKASLEPR